MQFASTRSAQDPEGLLAHKGFVSAWTENSYWEVHFDEPIEISGMYLTSAAGRLAKDSYGVCIDARTPSGTYRYDSIAQDVLHSNIARYEADVREFESTAVNDCGLAAQRVAAITDAVVDMLAALRNSIAGDSSEYDFLGMRTEILANLTNLFSDEIRTSKRALIVKGGELARPLFQGNWPDGDQCTRDVFMRSVSLALAGHLAASADSTVRRNVFASYAHFIRSYRDIELIENFLFLQSPCLTADHTTAHFSVMTHGVSRPFLQDNEDAYIRELAALQATLSDNGYLSCLCYGTLLGAVREGGLIAHDDDIDMAVVISSAEKEVGLRDVASALERSGFQAALDKRAYLRVKRKSGPISIDLFPIIPESEKSVLMLMEGMKIRAVPRRVVLPLGSMMFKGMQFGVPADPEGFLEERYGPGWRVPQRKIFHRMIS
ncbi:LicD family protein [Hansschlegelia beijingensis]